MKESDTLTIQRYDTKPSVTMLIIHARVFKATIVFIIPNVSDVLIK